MQFHLPTGQEFIMEPGDVLGWYDSEAGAIGYDDIDGMGMNPVCLGHDIDQPSTAAENEITLDAGITHRNYGTRVCYSE